MELLKRRVKMSVTSLALLATGLIACREIQQASVFPEYCRFTEIGPLCDSYDPSALPYPVALGLRPLDGLEPPDRQIVAAHIDAMKPRPRLAHILAPVGPVPEGLRPYDREVPQSFHVPGNPRLALVAVATKESRAKVDVHAVMLAEGRVLTSHRLAAGLERGRLRGSTRNGDYLAGFSLSDRPDSRGDLFLLRQRHNGVGLPMDQWARNFVWHRIDADSRERKLDWFRSIANPGSCAGSIVGDRMMLAPVPRSWFEEYARTCPTHPGGPEFGRSVRQTG